MQDAKTIFFDLDGTLTDPKEGITKSIRFALEQMGHPSPSLDELSQLIGPPLGDYFSAVLGADKVDAALKHYRQRYNNEGACLMENIVYSDIADVLDALRQHHKALFVATTKPHAIAERIIQHFGMRRFFKHIYGSELDGTRSNKAELIAHILKEEELSPDSIVMVGDRKHDILGAANNNIRSIGVCWGYGSVVELTSAGATALVKQPKDLLKILIGA